MARAFNKKSHELAIPSLVHGAYVHVEILINDATYREKDGKAKRPVHFLFAVSNHHHGHYVSSIFITYIIVNTRQSVMIPLFSRKLNYATVKPSNGDRVISNLNVTSVFIIPDRMINMSPIICGTLEGTSKVRRPVSRQQNFK